MFAITIGLSIDTVPSNHMANVNAPKIYEKYA